MRAAAVDELLEFGAGDDALIGRAPGFVVRARHRGGIRSLGRSNLDQGCAHVPIKASRRLGFKVHR